MEKCRAHVGRAVFVYSEAEFSPLLLVPPVEQACNALPKHRK